MTFKLTFRLMALKFTQPILIALAIGLVANMSTFPAFATTATTTAKEQAEPAIPDQVKLDAKQKEKIIAIRTDAIKEIRGTLTPAQQPKFDEGIKKNQKLAAVLNSLSLNNDQKTKIKSTIQKSNEKIRAVLTPEQIKTIEKNKQTNPPKK
jgi:Spy/CpxP family protein refolding chaperone